MMANLIVDLIGLRMSRRLVKYTSGYVGEYVSRIFPLQRKILKIMINRVSAAH